MPVLVELPLDIERLLRDTAAQSHVSPETLARDLLVRSLHAVGGNGVNTEQPIQLFIAPDSFDALDEMTRLNEIIGDYAVLPPSERLRIKSPL